MKVSPTILCQLILPSAAIFLAGCNLNVSGTSPLPQDIPQESRQLTMRAPEMVCIGCTGSVEAAIGALQGVHYVHADAGTKEVYIIYDPARITDDQILSRSVFDAYGREFVSDEPYQSSLP